MAAAALVAAAILAYFNGFSATFQFDDRAVILEDPRLAGPSVFLEQAGRMIRPLLKLTFLIDRHLYGDNPAGYHALNLLLHCGSVLLVFAILSLAARRARDAGASTFRWVPFWAALLFAVHPIGTETVTYLSGRATGLAAIFTLLSAYLFLRATAPDTTGRSFLSYYTGAMAGYVLALLSKEVALTLPGLLLLWHLVFGADGAESRGRAIRLQAPIWIISLLFFGVAAWHPRYPALARASLEARPLWDNLVTQLNAVSYALSLFVFPSRLNFDHDLLVYHSILQWPIPLALALLAAMAAVAAWSARRTPLVSLGIWWFFLCLLPTNSLIPRYDILSERNLYLPSIGLFLAATAFSAGVVARCGRAWPRTVRIASGAVCVGVSIWLFAATVDRNRVYRDEIAFWSDAARKSPQKSRPHNNLGYAWMEAGNLDLALEEFRIALALDRNNATARQNLLRAWLLKQRQETSRLSPQVVQFLITATHRPSTCSGRPELAEGRGRRGARLMTDSSDSLSRFGVTSCW
jgi:uncharacterized membrane protein YhaH (DUF805 family)